MRARELAKSLDLPLIRVGVTSHDLATHWTIARRLHVASVVVPPVMIGTATNALRGGDVTVCTVIAYPCGSDDPKVTTSAVDRAVVEDVREVDVAMDISALVSGRVDQARAELGHAVDAARDSTSSRVMVRAVVEAPLLGERVLRRACGEITLAGADCAVTAPGIAASARTRDVEINGEAPSVAVGMIARGGIVGVIPAIALVPAGAQRVATNAADVMVQTLMGVAA